MSSKYSRDEILKYIGDLSEYVRESRQFRKDARLLSEKHAQLLKKYPNQWVVFYKGKVRAHGDTHESVLAQIDKKGISRENILVRFLDENPPILILSLWR